MEWINIKDKIPDKDVEVLIYDNGVLFVSHFEKMEFGRAAFPDYQDEQPSYIWPTHWMPLPDKPIS